MSDAETEDKVELYEHFFRDPRVGEGVLQPPRAGIACQNIREALRYLGYSVAPGERYDEEVLKAIVRFQTEYNHNRQDGLVGPGTRRLLTQAVIDRGEGFFSRGRVSPEYAVFLSYSRQDEARLTGLIEGIRSRGIPVFRDKEAIPGGASWPDMLFRSVRKCQVFLCMLSPHSASSINVLIEVALARHANRPILPVLIHYAKLPSVLESLLGNFQRIDLSDKAEMTEGLAVLMEALSIYGLVARAPQ